MVSEPSPPHTPMLPINLTISHKLLILTTAPLRTEETVRIPANLNPDSQRAVSGCGE